MNLVGMRFGRLVVTAHIKGSRHGAVETICDCGNAHISYSSNLTRTGKGASRSCGCLNREICAALQTKHGACKTPEYRSWKNMIVRCENKNIKHYDRYGGRGIKVCDEWRQDFTKFLEHVGPRPSQRHSIDRINNDGDYEPGNVRWATMKMQARNTKRSVVVVVNGKEECAIDVWRMGNVPSGTFYNRLKKGWDPIEAATTPPIPTGKRRHTKDGPASACGGTA